MFYADGMDGALATSAEPPRSRIGAWRELVVPPLDKPSKHWSVSPVVDLAAYQLSWLWVLVPLALQGPKHPRDYLFLWVFALTVSSMHRHWTMPYVYLDRQVFSQHVTRFSLFMYLLMLGFLASALGWNWKAPVGFFQPADLALFVTGSIVVVETVIADRRGHRFGLAALLTVAVPFTLLVGSGLAGFLTGERHALVAACGSVVFALVSVAVALDVRKGASESARKVALVFPGLALLAAVAGGASLAIADVSLNPEPVSGAGIVGVFGAVAALWNIWHTLMQKFGILRMYAAKSAVPVADRAPAWSDRLLVFGSLPLVAFYLAPSQRATVASVNKNVTQFLLPVIDGLTRARPIVLPVAAVLAAASVGFFVFYEWRANRLRSWPRVTMGASLVALSACFLFVSPIKVFIAYGFSHAVEYCVFVWAFLRRRYAKPQPARPLIQRALRHPWLAYGLFSLAIAGTCFLLDPAGHYGINDGRMHLYGVSLATWMFAFTIWHSMAHFYFDGFLWKMRAPETRANI